MVKYNPFTLLFSIVAVLSNPAYANEEEARALSKLKTFQWSELLSDVPPCPSVDCHLTWATPAMALGDAHNYARRVKVKSMQQYADAKGIRQNFEAVAKLESLAPATPSHIDEQYQIEMRNLPKSREDADNLVVDSRVFIEIFVNNISTIVIFDTGATLTLPSRIPAATTLNVLGIPTNNTSGLGKTEFNMFTTAKEVSIGNIRIENLMVKQKEGLPMGDINEVGLFGYDLLLRFDSVNVDLRSGGIKFNAPIDHHGYCVPMELIVDNDRLPAGLAVNLMIDDTSFKARIDTGANVDVLLHGMDTMPWKIGKPSRVMGIDSGGNISPLEELKGDISLDKVTPTHTILRTPLQHDEFKATLGIKFFIGHSFTFDFKHSQFCLD